MRNPRSLWGRLWGFWRQWRARGMTFPTVEGRITSREQFAVNFHTVSLPSGIVAGELLLVFFGGQPANGIQFPAGWTKFYDLSGSPFGDDNKIEIGVGFRFADGNEGATIEVVGPGEVSAHTAYRISGAGPSIAPETSDPNDPLATGDSNQPLAIICTPTGGAKDYLWFAGFAANNDNPVIAGPSGFTDEQSLSSAGILRTHTEERLLNAASLDPNPQWGNGTQEEWVVVTLAVHPIGPPRIDRDISLESGSLTTIKKDASLTTRLRSGKIDLTLIEKED